MSRGLRRAARGLRAVSSPLERGAQEEASAAQDIPLSLEGESLPSGLTRGAFRRDLARAKLCASRMAGRVRGSPFDGASRDLQRKPPPGARDARRPPHEGEVWAAANENESEALICKAGESGKVCCTPKPVILRCDRRAPSTLLVIAGLDPRIESGDRLRQSIPLALHLAEAKRNGCPDSSLRPGRRSRTRVSGHDERCGRSGEARAKRTGRHPEVRVKRVRRHPEVRAKRASKDDASFLAILRGPLSAAAAG